MILLGTSFLFRLKRSIMEILSGRPLAPAYSVAAGILLAGPFLFPTLFPLAWIAFIPLLFAVRQARTLWQAFFFGWLSGVIANLAGFYWLIYTIRVFGGFSYSLSVLIFALFIALEALQMAFFSFFVRLCGPGPLYLFPALFWVALEFWFPHLFPWHFANTQARFLTLIQSADLVGPYGTTLLLTWLNTTLYGAIFPSRGRANSLLRPAAALGIVVVGVLIYGHFRLSAVTLEMRGAPKLALAAVQGNIGIKRKWDTDQLWNNLKTYRDLTGKVRGATVVVWPETAVETWLPESSRTIPREILPQLNSGTSFFIFGVRSFRGDLAGPEFRAFNGAFLADAQGRILGRYHKQILIPFGEYIPFASLLSTLPGIPPFNSGFSEGNGPRTLDLAGGIRIAPLICYEDLLPELSRAFVAEKDANLLVNLTNDAWYGKTVAPWQHARLAQWRAIETRRTLVRVTNTGLTTVIDARGEARQTLPTFTPATLKGQVELMDGKSPYVLYGDWFAWMVSLVSAAIVSSRAKQKLGVNW